MVKSTEELIQQALAKSMSYAEYRALVATLAVNGSSTGPVQTDDLANYTKLNDRRMRRWDKMVKITEELAQEIENINKNHTWLVLTESWCGDASPALPIMEKVASLNPGITFRVVLRDENEALMGRFLTNGGMSIPKLIVLDNATQTVIGTWGPRSGNATKLVEDHKAMHGAILPQFKEELQVWYNTDKGESILTEVLELLTLE
jgi:hypothetical protein